MSLLLTLAHPLGLKEIDELFVSLGKAYTQLTDHLIKKF